MQKTATFSIANFTNEWAQKNNLRVLFRPSIDSTNSLAKELLTSAPSELDLILCDQQPAGRGRGSNTWISPSSGSSLFGSWIFSLDYAPQPILAPLVGLSLHTAAVKAFSSTEFGLKAPNDLYLGTQKIAGLLIENVQIGSRTHCVVGLGLNVFSAPDLQSAGHLSNNISVTKKFKVDELNFGIFLAEFLREMKLAISSSQSETLTDESRARLVAALNARVGSEPVVSVGPRGELQTKSGTISWMEL